MWWIFRVLFSTLFLLSVVLSIPIAFDVGGRDAGLAYSLGLFLYYGTYSSIKLAVRLATTDDDDDDDDNDRRPSREAAAAARARARVRFAVAAGLRLSQWIVLPALLFWALRRFAAVDADNTDWVARTVAHVTGSEGGGVGPASSSSSVAVGLGQRVAGLFFGSGSSGSGSSSSQSAAAKATSAAAAAVAAASPSSPSTTAAAARAAAKAASYFGVWPAAGAGWGDWLLGRGGVVESAALGGWQNTLLYSSPVFQLLEGFCTLLVIQAAGQISRWLVNRGRSDTWVIILIAFSGSVIASAVYFLSRVARFPQVDTVDAVLIGVTITSAVFLCAYGIGSGRGNPVESSLLFAYVVLCVYQIFTDYQPSSPAAAARLRERQQQQQQWLQQHQQQQPQQQPPPLEFPPLPPVLMASYATLVRLLGSLPTALVSTPRFVAAALQTITPSVVISLTYRIIVFYCATRIIPAVRASGARALLQEPTLEDLDSASKLLGFLSWYSASALIAIYTSLLLQHIGVAAASAAAAASASASASAPASSLAGDFAAAAARGIPWRWVNAVGVMALYAVEMYLGTDDLDGGLTNHWKMD